MEKPLTSIDDYRTLGGSGLRVSPLCLGTITFGTRWENLMASCNREAAEALFARYVNLGGNFIDTANKYHEGETEQWLGEFVQRRGRREDLVIATKYSLPMPMGSANFCGNHRKNMLQSLRKSLERLQTHYIDLFYVHFWDFVTPEVEMMRAMDDLLRSGKVLHLGVSAMPAWAVARCNTLAERFGWSPFTAYHGRHNIGDRSMERDVIPMCMKLGLGVVPWSILGAGKFTARLSNGNGSTPRSNMGKELSLGTRDMRINSAVNRIAWEIGRTPTQVLLNWELQQPGITSPVLGVQRMSHLEDSLAALSFTLEPHHVRELTHAAKFDFGFPIEIIGTSYSNSPWVKWSRGGR